MTPSLSILKALGRRAALMAALFLAPALAFAQAPTMITSLPAIISSPGSYLLAPGVSTAAVIDNAITIKASNVELDLGGNAMDCFGTPNNPKLPGSGVSVAYWVSGVRISHGRISGMDTGVSLFAWCKDVEVTGLTIEGCTMGIFAQGQDLDIHGNLIRNIGGPAGGDACGILVYGPSIRIWDNTIRNIRPSTGQSAFGIMINGGYTAPSNGEVKGNRIFTLQGLPNSYGIGVYNTFGMDVSGNHIVNGTYGIFALNPAPGVKFGNNVVTGATYPYTGGVDIGNNH